MSQRDRAAEVAPPAIAAGPPRNGAAPPAWDELFPAAPPDQQRALLALAAQQGFLHARQLPILNGASDHSSRLLPSLLADESTALAAFQPEPLEYVDKELDEVQRGAVARALHTPDLALLVGLPGTGKSRTIAEVIRQAARRGQRVLLCCPTPAGLDTVLVRLDGDPRTFPLRCLGRSETADALPPASAAMTVAAHMRQFGDEAIARAERTATELEAEAVRLAQTETALQKLVELFRRRGQIDADIGECEATRQRLPEQVRRFAIEPAGNDAFERTIRARASEVQIILDRLTADSLAAEVQRDRLEREANSLAGRAAELHALAAARQHWRVLSGRFWQALKSGDISARLADVQTRRQAAQAARDQEAAKRASFEREQQAAERAWHAERDRLVEREIVRRLAVAGDELAALRRERCEIDDKLSQTARQLGPDAPPAGTDPGPNREAALLRATQARRDSEQARRWAAGLAEHSANLPSRLWQSVNVVAATPAALSEDAAVAEIARRGPFDLLVLDEAHGVAEADLYQLARRANRWLLVGEPMPDSVLPAEPVPPSTQRPERGHSGRQDGAAQLPRPRSRPVAQAPVLARLWHQLHCDGWRSEAGRVVCQLRPLLPAARNRLESERLADHPEVELRILTPPTGDPALAEVAFPAGMTIDRAKILLYRDLDELPVPAAAGAWENGPARWTYRFAASLGAKAVELEPGLRELVRENGACWQTVAFEFDRDAWPRDRAEAWAKRHLRPHDTGRTARFSVPYRMRPALANFASQLCFGGAYAHRSAAPTACSPIIEFIPVPALPGEGGGPRRRGDHGGNGLPRRLPPLRGGAGQELDLSDARHRERLPAELRANLPGHGFVNLSEAHAVVRLLETLLGGGWSSPLAVLPLYAAQAEVVRHFARQAPLLARSAVPLAIEHAAAYRQRECETAIVCLTRSHGHRAVSYGDEPGLLPLAVSRAKQRLILVGDAGTLVRRSQWDGPLDRLDAAAAAAEKAWVAYLVGQLSGATLPAAVHLHEGPP